MQIVHVEDFFHPDAGYQLNMLAPLQVSQGHAVTIVAGDMAKIPSYLKGFFGTNDIAERDTLFERKTGVKIIRVPLLAFLSGRALFSPKVIKLVCQLNPDVVLAHGIDSATGICFTVLSRFFSFPVVVDCHMVAIASKNRFSNFFRKFYATFIAPIVIKNKISVIRLFDDNYVERHLGVSLEKTIYHQYGTDTSYFKPDTIQRRKLRNENHISEDDFVVLYAGKMDEAKGGAFLAECIQEKFLLKNNKKIVFLIVGNVSGEYELAVEKKLSGSENTVIRVPTQKYRELLTYYRMSDMAIYPKQCSMSFFEAQACELPVLFEDNDINKTRALLDNAITFKADDVNDFRMKLIMLAEKGEEEFTEMGHRARKYILEDYDYTKIAQQITDTMIIARRNWEERKNKG